MTKPKKPCDVYVRVSTVRGREGDSYISPDVQEERCRSAAAARGVKVGHVFKDEDQSGAKMSRPAFDKALARIESGESGGIIVARLDRFGRSLVGGLQTIKRIEDAGGVVITADGDLDTSTPVGRLVMRVMFTLAEFEIERIGEAWRTAQGRAVARGAAMGPRPYGYEKGPDGRLRPKPGEAEGVTAAFEARAGGASIRDCVAILGGDHHPATVHRLLRMRLYLGELKRGEHTIENAHPALTDVPTFLAAQRPTNPKPRKRKDSAMLSGLCRCSSCGYLLTQSGRFYVCNNGRARGCKAPVSIRTEDADRLALELLLLPYDDAEIEEKQADLKPFEDALRRAEERLKQAQGDDVQDALGHDEWVALLASRRREVEEAASALGALRAERRDDPEVLKVSEMILNAPVAEQRGAIARAFDFLAVDREKRVIAWEHGIAGDSVPRSGKRGHKPKPIERPTRGTALTWSSREKQAARLDRRTRRAA